MALRRAVRSVVVLVLTSSPALAVRPIVLHHDLIAGAGRAGFRDAGFADALFDTPLGLAAAADGSRLYVADRNNHRIRVVRLDQGSRVDTLAGSGRSGCADGSRGAASFAKPSALAAISRDRLVVWDGENNALREVDVRSGAVSTIGGGNGLTGEADGPALSVPVNDVWALAYDPSDESLYFTQPDFGLVKRLDLRAGLVESVVRRDPRLPQPAALCLFQGNLYVADRDSGRVYRIDAPRSADRPARLSPQRSGTRIVALAGTSDRLYALQAGGETPWLCLTTGRPVLLASMSGEALRSSEDPAQPYLQPADTAVGFVADPRSERAVIVANTNQHTVLGLKDYDFGDQLSTVSGAEGLTDFSYPKRKAPDVYRLLLVGDSRLYFTGPSRWTWGEGMSRMEVLPKRLELLLNLYAALDDHPRRYEVLCKGEVSWHPVLVWPHALVPDLAADYDADRLVLFVSMDAEESLLRAYVDRPATEEGVPSREADPEYLLTPALEKIERSPARRFYELCRARGNVKIVDTQAILALTVAELAQDPDVRKEAVELMRRPLRLLQQKVRARAGHPVPMTVVFLPPPQHVASDRSRDLWREVCAREKLELLDLVEPLYAAREAFAPIGVPGDFAHYNPRGHELLALLLAWRLRKVGIVPF